METESRNALKEKELRYLYEIYKTRPDFFERSTFYDDNEFLKIYGIEIPGKEMSPNGYLKFSPADFIVEEINLDGSRSTIDRPRNAPETAAAENLPTVYATLVKCNISTIQAIEELSSLLKCNKNQIHYSGIKDKDALTAQRISIRKVPIENIKHVSSHYFFLKDFDSGKGVMEKGALKGNRFSILIRTDEHFTKKETLDFFMNQLERVEKEGYYNFYYLQRFGSPRYINFYWGLLLLQGKYREAMFSFLGDTGKRESLYFRNLRDDVSKHFENWKYIKTKIDPLPLIFFNEHKVLNHLLRYPTDFTGAFRTIEDQVVLWIYAVSSWLFNKKISSYIHAGKNLPPKLPLFLNKDRNDFLPYQDILESVGMFPPSFENLRPFPFIQFMKREVSTKEKVHIQAAKVIPEGVVISFELGRGEYATTFLSHLFNLMSGKVPEGIRTGKVDTKKILGDKSSKPTMDYFEKILYSKDDDMFRQLKSE